MATVIQTVWFANTSTSAPMKLTIEAYSSSDANIIASELWDRLHYCGFHMVSSRPLRAEHQLPAAPTN